MKASSQLHFFSKESTVTFLLSKRSPFASERYFVVVLMRVRLLDGISFWSRIRESNPPPRLGKPMYYRCTNPALHGSCVEFLDIIASFLQKSNRFLAKRKNRASGGRPGGIQQSLAPAGMASSTMTRWSFSSPFSLCTAESSMPHDSWPIIFLGGRLTMAASVLPTRASGS